MFEVESLSDHVLREGREFGRRFGTRGLLIHAAILAVFGLWWPHLRGVGFFDPVFLAAYACLGVLFAGPAAAQAFQNPPRSMMDASARIFWATVYGEGFALLILSAGIAVVLRTRTVPIDPDWTGVASAALLGLAGSAAFAALSGWFALRFSAAAARLALRAMYLTLLVLFFFKSGWLPDVTGRAAFVCAGIAILAMFAIQRLLASQPVQDAARE
jgi:hypothetical protein